jgi:hypothetical protein
MPRGTMELLDRLEAEKRELELDIEHVNGIMAGGWWGRWCFYVRLFWYWVRGY